MPAEQPDPQVVVVAGGTGLVGSAVVRRLVADGARVVVPTRGADSHAPDGARVVRGVDWEHPETLLDVLTEPGWAPTGAVAALGGWWLGDQLVDVAPDVWRRILESHLTAHWLAVRAIAPVLVGPDPAYVLLNGAAATEPMPGSGPVNVTGAAQRMMVRVLREEPVGARVRFHEVSVLAAVGGDERNLDPGSEVDRADVAAAVVRTLADPASPAVVEVS
ncbi:SDR family oxidoreductase [Actinotalea sp. M2MS4P-6]|uniref:SDR family NAD(P)-dependent oxidoreductase n=1 Tax=Actinotalea sp. M2MS4P-6 TaxID=2983762 RepID=UPI0021E4708E|nr:SDR family oxidoreductase [Actinotalea sp. M2MS4P-6]MCV2396318.1 SDR family oxidoreductase [Actinotalea sp. M2MS4P-6]